MGELWGGRKKMTARERIIKIGRREVPNSTIDRMAAQGKTAAQIEQALGRIDPQKIGKVRRQIASRINSAGQGRGRRVSGSGGSKRVVREQQRCGTCKGKGKIPQFRNGRITYPPCDVCGGSGSR